MRSMGLIFAPLLLLSIMGCGSNSAKERQPNSFAGELDRAEKLFNNTGLGEKYAKEKKYIEAIAAYKSAEPYVGLSTDRSYIHRGLAPIYETLGRNTEAIESYKIIAANTQNPEVKSHAEEKIRKLTSAIESKNESRP